MPNPFNQPKPTQNLTNNVNGLKEAYQAFRQSGNNPMQMLQNLAMQNPQYKQFVDMLRNGVQPEAVFKRMCEAQGIDANKFIKMITQ